MEKEIQGYLADYQRTPEYRALLKKYPETLIKAFYDPFYYMLKMQDGSCIEFYMAKPSLLDGFFLVKNMGDERWLEINLKYVVALADGSNKYQSCLNFI